MAIRNRDGTIYRLSQPNPIMQEQEIWTDKVILHNFDEKPKYQSLEEIKPQELEVPIKKMPIPPKKPAKPKNIIIIHCMPATIHESHDPLYNENRISITYDSQFSMEAIISKSTDLSMEFWVKTDKATKGSIIYVPSDMRWWKIENLTPHKAGFLLECSPSTIQPSFETS